MYKILFIFSLLTKLIQSYSNIGHYLIANIAYEVLKKENPNILNNIVSDLKEFSTYTNQGNYDFIESASWLDEIKRNTNVFNTWHYNNEPIFDEDFINKQKILDSYSSNLIKLTYILEKSISTIGKISENRNKVIFEKSFAIKTIIHLVGDLHQPLHNTNYYNNKDFKKGDLGGNLFYVYLNRKRQNLHFLYDRIFFKYKNLKSPLSKGNYNYLQNITINLMKNYPVSSFEENFMEKNLDKWHMENYNIAKNFSYKNLKQEMNISDDYKNRAIYILETLIIKGGYRLANILLKNYKSNNKIVLNRYE